MGEQVLFAVYSVVAAAVGVMTAVVVSVLLPRLVRRRRRRRYLPRVHVQSVLAFLRESDQERDEIVHNRVRYVFRQAFLLHAVFVQRCHEIGQRLRHPELDF